MAFYIIQKQPLLLLICAYLTYLKSLKFDSKTTFVTVNLWIRSNIDRSGKIQKQPLLLLILWASIIRAWELIIQKQPLLLLIRRKFLALQSDEQFKNNLCYC